MWAGSDRVEPGPNLPATSLPRVDVIGRDRLFGFHRFEGFMAQGGGPSLDGVGLGYSPFLHRTLLSRPDRFDFVELPLEVYLDEAQRELLDPGLERVGAIAEARPCLWRGSGLSLGSALEADTTAIEARMRRLVDQTNAVLVREDLAFRRVDGRDLGLSQPLPLTESMADLAGGRCEALASRLPCRFAAGLSLDALVEAGGEVAAGFVRRLAVETGQDLALDLGAAAAAASPEVLSRILAAIPADRVVQIALTSSEAMVWPVLETVLAATGARSVLIRRTRNLFPLDDVFATLDRARAALDQAALAPRRAPRATAAAASGSGTGPDLAATIRDQAAFAARCRAEIEDAPLAADVAAVQARAVWRERVADLYRVKQLARWAERPASWRV